jgi:hypothetical protein
MESPSLSKGQKKMKPDEYDNEAIEAYKRKQALRQAISNAPRAVRRVLSQPIVKPHPIIATGGRSLGTTPGWTSWKGTQHPR